MRCYEIDLSKMLKVTMLNKTEIKPPLSHITRRINEYIVYVIKEGSLCLLQNDEEIRLMPGDVYIFNIGEYQKPKRNTECTFYYLHFLTEGFSQCEMTDEEYRKSVEDRKAGFVKANIYGSESYNYIKVLLKQRFNIKDSEHRESVFNLFKNNTISYGYNAPAWRMNVSFGAASILMKLEDICFEGSNREHKKGRASDTAVRIADYIEKHYRENFTSIDIERDLLINFDYANRIFKKNIGYSIIKYRNLLRINTAKTLVCDTNLDEVAAKVGFSDRYYFSRCFKKIEGVSPGEYRERLRQAREE